MKTFKFLLVILAAIALQLSCSSQGNNADAELKVGNEDEVKVYYFHFERRCVTCKAIESVTEEAIKEMYSGVVPFKAVNLDDEKGKGIAEEVGVSSQSLLIIMGDTRIDITAEAFMNATSKPEELKRILKEKIEPLLR